MTSQSPHHQPPQDLLDRTKAFALRIQALCRALPTDPEATAIRRQLTRCGTSVAANYRAARRARSKAEFRAKLGSVEEQAHETAFWLELIIGDELLPAARVRPLLGEANEIVAMTVASIKKARRPDGKQSKTVAASRRSDTSHFPLPLSPLRMGHGFDLHRLAEGKRLVVCGQHIEHDMGCDAHSDGDVVYHAVTDAILGALGQEDIGQLFPDTDKDWKDADSRIFVEEAVRRMTQAGYAIGNIDVTVILQRPKLSPYKSAMKANLVSLLGTADQRVNLKGKTHEKVDAVGQGKAIACHVVVLLEAVG